MAAVNRRCLGRPLLAPGEARIVLSPPRESLGWDALVWSNAGLTRVRGLGDALQCTQPAWTPQGPLALPRPGS